MKSSDLTLAQAEKLKEQVGRRLAYLNRLLARMTQRGFVPSDPLYTATLRAQAGLQELHMAAHYASCKSGVGKPAR